METLENGRATPVWAFESRIHRTAYGGSAMLLALPFVAFGGYLSLAGFGYLPLLGTAHAPLWVIGAVGVTFALAGAILLGYAVRGLSARRRVAELQRRRAAQPWLRDYPWDPQGIEDQPAGGWVRLLGLTAVVAALAVPFNWWAFASGEGTWMVRIAAAGMDLVVLVSALAFLYRLAAALKFGRSRLSFSRFPFSPGDVLSVGLSPNRFPNLDVTLRFVEEWFETRGHGRHRRVTLRSAQRWQARQRISPHRRDPEVAIRFQLPDNASWTTRLTADPGIAYWELLVEAQGPGIDYRARFPLPVYPRGHDRVAVPRRARPLSGRRLAAYRFELGLPLAVAALLGLAWYYAPQTLQRAGTAAATVWDGARLWMALEAVPGVYPDVMRLSTGPDGRVWVLSKYGLTRHASGDEQEVLLDRRRYRAQFGDKFNAWSTLYVDGIDQAWIGGWYGELFRYANGSWWRLSERGAPLAGRIRTIARRQDAVYLGGADGLWRWRPVHGLDRVEGLPPGNVGALLAMADGGLLVAVGGDIFRYAADRVEPLATLGPGTRSIDAMRWTASGRLLVGTSDGLVELSPGGEVLRRGLQGIRIAAVEPHADRIWAGTWGDGLYLGKGTSWRRVAAGGLSGDRVSGFAVDAQGGTWIGLYGDGLLHADSVERLIADDD